MTYHKNTYGHPRNPATARAFVDRFERDSFRLKNDAFVDAEGRDACGVGLVVAIDGEPNRQVVEAGIEALKALWHRGAVDADGMTGDGAGILVEIPQDFFPECCNFRMIFSEKSPMS